MEERRGEALAGTEQLTVIGKHLHTGDHAPDFRLDYMDLADVAICTVGLADSAGMVRLLNVVNSLERPVCQQVTRRWEALCAEFTAKSFSSESLMVIGTPCSGPSKRPCACRSL